MADVLSVTRECINAARDIVGGSIAECCPIQQAFSRLVPGHKVVVAFDALYVDDPGERRPVYLPKAARVVTRMSRLEWHSLVPQEILWPGLDGIVNAINSRS